MAERMSVAAPILSSALSASSQGIHRMASETSLSGGPPAEQVGLIA